MADSVDVKTVAVDRSRLAEKLIDTDVHPSFNDGFKMLFPYLPRAWRARMEHLANAPIGVGFGATRYIHVMGSQNLMIDARPPEGGKPGSSPDFMKKDLLDRYGIDVALLVAVEAAGAVGSASDADQAAVVVSAFNQHMIDHWLDDRRLRYALTVSPHDPESAAAEIRRHGNNRGIAAVFLPMLNIRWGHRHYHPIYKAACEFGLPVVTHPGSGEAVFIGTAQFAVGTPELFMERYVDLSHLAQANLTSVIAQGIFERFPDLKVMFLECGFSWLVTHLWRLDKAWAQGRIEVPWLTRSPSEYAHDHVRVSSQPVDEPENPRDLDTLIEGSLLRDVLVFSTDYPHWDADRPGDGLMSLSEETRRRVFYATAEGTLRL